MVDRLARLIACLSPWCHDALTSYACLDRGSSASIPEDCPNPTPAAVVPGAGVERHGDTPTPTPAPPALTSRERVQFYRAWQKLPEPLRKYWARHLKYASQQVKREIQRAVLRAVARNDWPSGYSTILEQAPFHQAAVPFHVTRMQHRGMDMDIHLDLGSSQT